MVTARKKRQERREDEDNFVPVPPKKPEPLTPRNERQADLMAAINESTTTVVIGPPGTGKSYIPSSLAAKAYDEKRIKRIVVVRPVVEACGEKLGYLPGDLYEKLAVWAYPIMDVIEERLGKTKFNAAVKRGDVSATALAYMRGRSLDDTFVIADEFQNATYEQVKLLVTRIGQRSKLVIDGDLWQSDIRGTSGLNILLDIIREQELDVPVIKFTTKDIVRSEECKMWTDAFLRHEGLS